MHSTTSNLKNPAQLPGLIALVMLLNLFFLSYLALTSQLIIFHDSIGYQNLAEMFTRGQWKEYFTMGPSREPLYSLVIALCMRIAQWQHLDYLAVQIMLQVAILITSQLLTYKLLKKLQISDGICALTLIYMGFSPAMVSSSLILFSEIITYPVVLWLILNVSTAWTHLKRNSASQIVLNAFAFAVAALLTTLVKGVFEIIVPLLLIPFLWMAAQAFIKNKKTIAVNSIIFFSIALLTFEIPIIAYKLTNQHYNGLYAFTDRGSRALYGSTIRRMQPLTTERIKIAFTYAIGPDICSCLYKDKCLQWSFLVSDILGIEKGAALHAQGLTTQQANDIYIRESLGAATKNPWQYFSLTLVEGLKFLFWEAPEISYIAYPDAIDKIYNWPYFKYTVRFIMALVTGWAIILGIMRLWANRKKLFNTDETLDNKVSVQFYLIYTIIVFAGLYSIFLVLPRYTLPIVPLFITIIAWQFDILIKNKKTRV